MTNINSNGFTKSSRGSDTRSDNLTVSDPSNAKKSAPQIAAESSKPDRFAEHLASATSNPSTTRPAALSIKPPTPRQATLHPARPAPEQANSTKSHETKAPWERSAPANRKPVNTAREPQPSLETPVSAKAPRTASSSLRSDPLQKASRSSHEPPVYATVPSAAPKPMPRQALEEASANPNRLNQAAPGAQAGSKDPLEASTQLSMPMTPESGEDWQQRLQEMLAAGSPELFMQQSPALALLAGRLEFIEPAQIPGLVAQSPLLQTILSQAQTAEVLQTALPLEQNLQILGLAPNSDQSETANALTVSTNSGLTPQPVVKLADTLEALGFNVARLVQEGELLKDNISLEGLQSYMQRAERLRSTLGLPLEWPTLPTAPDSLAKEQNPGNQTLDPALAAKLSRLAPQPSLSADTVQLWSQISEQPELMPLTVLDDGTDSPVFLASMDQAMGTVDPFAGTTVSKDPALASTSMDNNPLLMNSLPRAPSATQDPFLAMAQRWDSRNLLTISSEDLVSRDPAETSGEPTAANPQAPRSLDELLDLQLIQPPDFNTFMDSLTLPTQESSSLDISALEVSLQDVGSSLEDQGGDLSGQNQSFTSQDSNSFMAPTQNSAPTQKAFSIETATPQMPSAPVSQQQLQHILDNSSMLIKDGGGSIRLDLGSQEMGPLDLALDIQGNSVELRIITHSDQAREALAQELPKLRESLQNQNLNLEKVEIGLSYSSAWSQSSGNGQQNREQFSENMSESGSRGPQGIRSKSRSYHQSFVSGPEARVPLHNGLIQVRV